MCLFTHCVFVRIRVIPDEYILTTEVHEQVVILVLLARLDLATVLSLVYLNTQHGVVDQLP